VDRLTKSLVALAILMLLTLLLVITNPLQSSAQQGVLVIVVNTDMSEYMPGDRAIISGYISAGILKAGEPVVIQVFNPLGAMARADFTYHSSNGTFSYDLPIGGSLMSLAGSYRVVTTYAGQYQAEDTFSISGGAVDYMCRMTTCVYLLEFNDSTYPIMYQVNGRIENVAVDVESKSLIVDALV
jgi:hypothetical protein